MNPGISSRKAVYTSTVIFHFRGLSFGQRSSSEFKIYKSIYENFWYYLSLKILHDLFKGLCLLQKMTYNAKLIAPASYAQEIMKYLIKIM